ncbi:MAG TPA: hypothetical protein VKR31_11435 [Rhizomicrobium sp.]|nr:hypothetical protein [Rhizomicrobium sp.]
MTAQTRIMFTRRPGSLAGATALCAVLCFQAAALAKPVYTAVDVPGATGTEPAGINGAGTVAGVYTDSRYTSHCFVWAGGGTISYCDPKNSINTFVAGINDSGTVAGSWNDSSSQTHGFVYTANGTATAFDPKGSTRTTSGGIDANGDITGEYLDSNNVPHGFICTGTCQNATSFDVTGATATIGSAINDSQTVAGYYYDSGNKQHAFVRTAKGKVTTIDPQNSLYPEALFINDSGAIAGEYQDQEGSHHGFVRDASGNITSFQVDGATTFVGGLNSNGDVCGSYEFASSKGLTFWAFLRSSGGKITTWYYPRNRKHATCTGVNTDDATTGLYSRTREGALKGYTRTP